MTVLDVVLTGATGTVLPLPERTRRPTTSGPRHLVELLDLSALADREIGALLAG